MTIKVKCENSRDVCYEFHQIVDYKWLPLEFGELKLKTECSRCKMKTVIRIFDIPVDIEAGELIIGERKNIRIVVEHNDDLHKCYERLRVEDIGIKNGAILVARFWCSNCERGVRLEILGCGSIVLIDNNKILL